MEEETVEKAPESVNAAQGREERLEKIARNHVLGSMGVGLVPIPIVDLLGLMGVQLSMIKKVAAEYDVPFREDLGKSIITSLVGGFLPVAVGGTLSSLIKCIPLIGQTTGAITMPVISGASTYAVFKVFVQHFESGGTFLDLDPSKVRAYFSEQFTKGKKVAAEMKPDVPADTAA